MINHDPIPKVEKCPRCAKPTISFSTLKTNIVDPKYGAYYVEKSVRWCYPCTMDWKAMFWKFPVGKFDRRGDTK